MSKRDAGKTERLKRSASKIVYSSWARRKKSSHTEVKTQYLTYPECSEFAKVTGITRPKDWVMFFKSFKEEIPLEIPRDPSKFYLRKTHNDIIYWADYDEAKHILAKYNFTSKADFMNNYDKEKLKDKGIPKLASQRYKRSGTWINWLDFLGNTFVSYKELKKLVNDNGIKSFTEYEDWRKTCGIKGLPKKPGCYYKNSEQNKLVEMKRWGKCRTGRNEFKDRYEFFNSSKISKSEAKIRKNVISERRRLTRHTFTIDRFRFEMEIL